MTLAVNLDKTTSIMAMKDKEQWALKDAASHQGGAKDEKRLPADALKRLSRFVGYGNPQGPVWFLGLEEGLNMRSPARIFDHMVVRIEQFKEIEDCQCALKKLKVSRWHDASKPKLQPTWRWMASIMVGLEGGDHMSYNAICKYQRDCLARHGGKTMLAELFPLPKPNLDAWPELFRESFRYKDATEYRAAIRQRRIKWLKEKVQVYHPAFVICYGKGDNWEDFRTLFATVNFVDGCLNSLWKVGSNSQGFVILAPHFSWFSRFKENQQKGNECCGQIINYIRNCPSLWLTTAKKTSLS